MKCKTPVVYYVTHNAVYSEQTIRFQSKLISANTGDRYFLNCMALRFNIQSVIRKLGLHTNKFDSELCDLKQAWFQLQVVALYSRKRGNKMDASKRAQPPWKAPDGEEVPKLRLYNSLTRQKKFLGSFIWNASENNNNNKTENSDRHEDAQKDRWIITLGHLVDLAHY
ncbi:hypothetical protein FSP39_001240 [Pinctada imbricata]|uniref:Uncharacterized protein n=1 Tax=Pinctada imbricata TaxID=66713 RepID=A0AA88YA35_PINIB|nr:hypothetical protein FSP39_001240 [Pinctada imbricata]